MAEAAAYTPRSPYALTGNPVFGEMMHREGWQVLCSNPIAAVFLKSSEHEAFIARAAAHGIAALLKNGYQVKTLQEYH